MNSFQKSLVTMAGYDNGWDVAFEGEDSVTLTSANHRTTAVVRQDTSGWGGQWGQICPFDKSTGEPKALGNGTTGVACRNEDGWGKVIRDTCQPGRSDGISSRRVSHGGEIRDPGSVAFLQGTPRFGGAWTFRPEMRAFLRKP
jgi:hypothetical protein